MLPSAGSQDQKFSENVTQSCNFLFIGLFLKRGGFLAILGSFEYCAIPLASNQATFRANRNLWALSRRKVVGYTYSSSRSGIHFKHYT